MNLFNNLFPIFFILANYLLFYIFFRKKFSLSTSLIFSYLLSSIFLICINKIFLILKIITLYKLFIISIGIIFLYFLFKNLKILNKDYFYILSLVVKRKDKYFYYFLFFIFIYSLIQSVFVPPTNFDSLNYNITRNYLYVIENSIYPINNYLNQNILIMPLNSDLQFLTHASFNSDYFMNIFNFFGFFVMAIIFYKILTILDIKKKNIEISLFLFLSLSNIYLSQFNTKNDLQLLIYFLMILYFLFEIIKNNKNYISYIILAIAFVSGIKWTAIFFLIPILIVLFITLYKKDIVVLFLNNCFIYLPIILIILPIEIIYFNVNYFNSITGDAGSTGSLFLNSDGLKGMLSNLLRYFISSIDLVLPVHKLGLEFITDFFNKMNNYLQNLLFSEKSLGLAIIIKDSVFFDYSYTLRPHSDFTFFGILGCFLFICPFLFYKAKNRYQKILCFIAIFFILSISYTISWFPWNARYISIFFAIGALLFACFAGYYINKFKTIFKIYICTLVSFNLFTHIPQPLIKHSQTESWINAIYNRENFKRFTIPEIEKVKKLKKYIRNGEPIIVMMENNDELARLDGPAQSNYQILRDFNGSYIRFVNTNFQSLNQNKNITLRKEEIQNYFYIINFSNKNLDNIGYHCINCQTQNEYKIYKTK